MKRFPPQILVLEDDKPVRDIVSLILTEAGIEVEATADALTAIEKINSGDFDLIIADVRLPDGVDGVDTVRAARASRPGLRSLFISGKEAPVVEDPETDEFIQKPFKSHELLGCVWHLLLRDVADQRTQAKRAAERCIAAAKVDCLRQTRSRKRKSRAISWLQR